MPDPVSPGWERPPSSLDDDVASDLARHLAATLPSILPPGLGARARGTVVAVTAAPSDRPRDVIEVDLTAYRAGPDSSARVADRAGGVGTRVLDEVQDAVCIETREAWPRVDGRMGTPAVEVTTDAVVLGFGPVRTGPPDPAWSLPAYRPPR